ncbi:hypothetical protein SAY86_015410 [Trapa natans]|uniref:Uncharacterized protein n=1 Tax=Trapa natans TaxID=22666 RepID=A0AAN7QKF5_TRANT|nr:hypothetical protein SAY86_015410 [Trapa natans]
MAIIDNDPKLESHLNLLADLPVIQKHVVAVEKHLDIAQPSGVFKKRGHKRVLRKPAVTARSYALKRELPSEFHRVIQRFHSVELKLIIEKALTGSDMNRCLGRISLRSSNVVADFLRPEERHCLENREDIPVLVISPSLYVSGLSLKS